MHLAWFYWELFGYFNLICNFGCWLENILYHMNEVSIFSFNVILIKRCFKIMKCLWYNWIYNVKWTLVYINDVTIHILLWHIQIKYSINSKFKLCMISRKEHSFILVHFYCFPVSSAGCADCPHSGPQSSVSRGRIWGDHFTTVYSPRPVRPAGPPLRWWMAVIQHSIVTLYCSMKMAFKGTILLHTHHVLEA